MASNRGRDFFENVDAEMSLSTYSAATGRPSRSASARASSTYRLTPRKSSGSSVFEMRA